MARGTGVSRTGAVLQAFVDDAAHLSIKDQPGWRAVLKRLAGQNVLLSIKPVPLRQSKGPMRYYRGVVVVDIAKATGITDPGDYESVHDALAWKFLRLPDDERFGTPRRRSTAKNDLSADEMSDYISQVIRYAETSIPDCRIRRVGEIDMDEVFDPGWA